MNFESAGASPGMDVSPVVVTGGEAGQGSAVAEGTRPWGPTQANERINVIDVLRGMALFGIIAANMRGFAGPLYTYFRPEVLWTTRTDFWTQAFVDTFIQGKFITIFAFLFGVGFALQFGRAEQRGGRFVQVYRRRQLALMLIGGLHQLLFWWGDVLVTYSLGGLLMILFRRRKSKTILIWVLALMFAPLLGGVGYLTYKHYRPTSPQKIARQKVEAEAARQTDLAEMRDTIKMYQTGSFAAIYKERVGELWHENRSQPFVVAMTLPLFMLGLLVYRLGIFQNPEAHRAVLKKALVIGAVVGVPASIATTYIMHITNGMGQNGPPTALQMFGFSLVIFGRPAMSMFYASAVVLLFLNTKWRARLLPFAVIGRTALTNYLFQTVFCTTIFFGYGGGLYAKVHLAWLMVISVAVYALQVPLSKWWLARYRFGPVEWVWRSLTYGRMQPMKV